MNAFTETRLGDTTAISSGVIGAICNDAIHGAIARLESAAAAYHNALGENSAAWDADLPEAEFATMIEFDEAKCEAAREEFDQAFQAVMESPPSSMAQLQRYTEMCAGLLRDGYGYLLVESDEKMGKVVPMMECVVEATKRISGHGAAPRLLNVAVLENAVASDSESLARWSDAGEPDEWPALAVTGARMGEALVACADEGLPTLFAVNLAMGATVRLYERGDATFFNDDGDCGPLDRVLQAIAGAVEALA